MIRQVGDTAIQPLHRARCHCGAVVLELALPNGIVDPFLIADIPVSDGIRHPADRADTAP